MKYTNTIMYSLFFVGGINFCILVEDAIRCRNITLIFSSMIVVGCLGMGIVLNYTRTK